MDERTTITDLERRLAESEARYHLLTQSWAQAVWETDADGMVVIDSPSWRTYTGQTLDEWLRYGWLDAIHPDDRVYAEKQWREATAARGLVDAEFRLRAPDGGWRWTNVRAVPLLDADGTIAKWAGMNIDIDARKHAEMALRQSEERRQLALEATDLAVYEWDLITDRLQTNERFRELVGIAPGDPFTGAQVMDYCIHPDDRARIDPDLARATDSASDGKFFFEHRLSRRGPLGHPWVLSHGQVFFAGPDDARRPVRVYGTLQDITDRKLSEIAVRESEERQAFLLKLSDHLRAEPDADAVAHRALQMLLDHLQLDRCYIGIYLPAEDRADLPHQVGNDAVPPLPASIRLSDFPNALRVAAEGTLVIDDFGETKGLSDTDRQNIGGLGLRALVAATLRKGEHNPLWTTVAVSSHARRWTPSDIAVIEEAAERIWAAIERAHAEAALRESEERFAQFAASSSDALWIRDAATLTMEYTSPAIQEIYGIAPDAIRGDVARWNELVVPEDRETAMVHIEQAKAGAPVTHEFRVRRPADGEVRWIRNTNFPLRDAAGRVRRIGGIAQDVTETKLTSRRLEVLVNELQHRARNLLGVVMAVADRTVKQGGSVEAFEERLQALSRAQGLLSQGGSDTVEVGALVKAELAAHANGASARATTTGPEVHLQARQVQNFALALHELTTNAVKYGALKVETGRLAVFWEVMLDRRERRRLALSWIESGVAIDVDQVTRRGYGTELIQEALAYALNATVNYELSPDGVRCRIEMPVP